MFKLTKPVIFSLFFSLILFVTSQASASVSVSNPTSESVTVSQKSHKASRLQTWMIKKIMHKIEKRKAKIDQYLKEGKIKKATKDISKLMLAGLIFLILGLVFLLLVNYVLGALFLVIGLVLLLVGLV
jgi:hypothetical protein